MFYLYSCGCVAAPLHDGTILGISDCCREGDDPELSFRDVTLRLSEKTREPLSPEAVAKLLWKIGVQVDGGNCLDELRAVSKRAGL